MKVLGIDIESTKMAKKLRAIAKHSNELADELDAIENEWQCECGAAEYNDSKLFDDDVILEGVRSCLRCGESYAIPSDDDLPTRLEGSE